MADINVRVTIKDGDLANRIRKFGLSILDLSESMDQIGDYLDAFFANEVFASRGRVIGEPWAALNARYAAYKAKKWPGRPPLVRTGLMQRGFRHKSTALTTSLYNEASYFDIHQDGDGLPQRMMMKVDETRARKVAQFIADDIKGKMGKAGV